MFRRTASELLRAEVLPGLETGLRRSQHQPEFSSSSAF